MDQNHDFAALRNLLALKKLETPLETNVDRFLIELHRRQRAGLLEPATPWTRFSAALGEWMAGLSMGKSFSYGSAFAAVALITVFSLSPSAQSSATADGGQFKLSLHLPSRDSAYALLPVSFSPAAAAPTALPHSAEVSFAASRASTTRFVLAKPTLAYDANAF